MAENTIPNLQREFQANLKAAMDLNGKPDKTEEEAAQAAQLYDKAIQLKASIDRAVELAKLGEWAESSQGMLPLAGAQPGGEGKAHFEGLIPAGEVTVGQTAKSLTTRNGLKRMVFGMEILDDDAEGFVDQRTLGVIRQAEYKAAFKAYLRKSMSNMNSAEVKAINEGTDTAGGFLVPEDMLMRIISREPTPTRIAAQVTQLQTSRDALSIPKSIYTTDDTYTTPFRVKWTGEVPDSATAHRVVEPAWGNVRIPVYTAMMSIPLTLDMIEDSAFPIMTWVSNKFMEVIDILRDDMVLNGDAVAKPDGILRAPGTDADKYPKIVVSGDAATLKPDGIMDLLFDLPEQYDENAVIVMSRTSTAKVIAKMKDQDQRYMWATGSQDDKLVGDFRTRPLLGYPVIYSALMPGVAAGTYPIIFGDLSGYALVNRVGFSIQVIREKYAENNQLVLLGRLRFGGGLVEPWRLRVHKVST